VVDILIVSGYEQIALTQINNHLEYGTLHLHRLDAHLCWQVIHFELLVK